MSISHQKEGKICACAFLVAERVSVIEATMSSGPGLSERTCRHAKECQLVTLSNVNVRSTKSVSAFRLARAQIRRKSGFARTSGGLTLVGLFIGWLAGARQNMRVRIPSIILYF